MTHVKGPAHKVPLQQRAVDSLIFDHFRSMGYEYSLSVFMPESGLNETPLALDDVQRILKLPTGKTNTISNPEGPPQSALMSVLASAVAKSQEGAGNETGTQTGGDAVEMDLESKLRAVDTAYEKQLDSPSQFSRSGHGRDSPQVSARG